MEGLAGPSQSLAGGVADTRTVDSPSTVVSGRVAGNDGGEGYINVGDENESGSDLDLEI